MTPPERPGQETVAALEFRPGWKVDYHRTMVRADGGDWFPLVLRTITGPKGEQYVEPASDFEDALLRLVKASAAEPLRGALELEVLADRLEGVFNLMHPGQLTEDELHGIAQGVWFALEQVRAALEATAEASER